MSVYELPRLPYAYDGLEPIINAQTVEIHYNKHHRAYLDNLNRTLEGYEEIAKDKSAEMLLSELILIPSAIRQKVINFGGGYVNHNLYWYIVSPNGGGEPAGNLAKAINETFGSFAKFKEAFSSQAKAVFGSGWTWLAVDNATKKLEIISTANQDTPYSINKTPIMTIDVWEHAYYLDYQNRRAEYVDNFWKILNWDEIGKRYEFAMRK